MKVEDFPTSTTVQTVDGQDYEVTVIRWDKVVWPLLDSWGVGHLDKKCPHAHGLAPKDASPENLEARDPWPCKVCVDLPEKYLEPWQQLAAKTQREASEGSVLARMAVACGKPAAAAYQTRQGPLAAFAANWKRVAAEQDPEAQALKRRVPRGEK